MATLTNDQERDCAAAVRLLAARVIYNSLRGGALLTTGDIKRAVRVVLELDEEIIAQVPGPGPPP